MKLIKISQEENSPQQIEMQQAQAVIQQGLANINKSLETLESTNVSSLFNRTELINSMIDRKHRPKRSKSSDRGHDSDYKDDSCHK